MKRSKYATQPTKTQQFTLYFMIFIGVCSMFYFLNTLFNTSIVANRTLYWLLIVTLVFTCLKIVYEWYHYLFIAVPKTPPTEKIYTVDIFTTFCAGEPYEMIVETLTALQEVRYPHETYLCDEADDPYLKEICKNLGIHHVTRTEKINAKAGNINNALKQSVGELCVVLDPDHVPFPEFLDPIVNHFNDPTVGYVQIVQAYANHHESLVAKGAAQQTYQFYGPMMMTMNSYGTVQAIGANCTFRRTALDSIGGHAAGLAEDMHTAMQLHAKGWKSVYVPIILARGLVPATLSAYYKQQLKWSRGVFELLFTSYIQLFSKFNWHQKLHYGILPFHYLSGIIYLLNFLIPIVSLFGDVYPLQLDLLTFAINSFPLVISTIIIRQYVQQWVMEDSERGFHIVGGLLNIGTWWVFIVGFVYTIFRKKVPYIPTEKETKDENNLIINLPNIVVFILSIIAILYGLYFDWNPFTFMMSGLAFVNCLIIFFIFLASEQLKIRNFRRSSQYNKFLHTNKEFLNEVWDLRYNIYKGISKTGLLLMIIGISTCIYFIDVSSQEVEQIKVISKKNIFLNGIFAPEQASGLSSTRLIKKYESEFKTHFDIISFYIPWGNREQCFIPKSAIDSVYKNKSIPMITWEPWQVLFENNQDPSKAYHDQKVFVNIRNGKFDDYIKRFALDIKALNRPVFLRFAHEADNPFYPWSKTGNNTSQEFKVAWKYLYDFFQKNHVYNVVWVWNPWKPLAVNEYFPGKEYVDWIGVTGLNFAQYNDNKKGYSFEELYRPFHTISVFRSGLPVMIAEMGSLKVAGSQESWINNGLNKIKKDFHEVKGFVLFNSSLDKNMPDGSTDTLDWTVVKSSMLSDILRKHRANQAIKPFFIKEDRTLQSSKARLDSSKMFLNTHGVNYTKNLYWYKNFTPLNRKIILNDFQEMQKAGINTIKCYGPNVYDKLIFDVSTQLGIQIHYGFWTSDNIDYVNDKKQLSKLSSTILDFVKDNKENKAIIAWNIADNALRKLDKVYDKPELFYQQQAYFTWLRDLVKKIKLIDSHRLVTVDVMVDKKLIYLTNMIHYYVPEIDSYGIILPDKTPDFVQIKRLEVPYFYSNIHIKPYLRLSNTNKVGAIIENWQDQENGTTITFDGLKDKEGRNRPSLYQLSKLWHGKIDPNNLPVIKILRPAMTTLQNRSLPYYALLYKGNKWQIAENNDNDLTFEWYLVKIDAFGVGTSMKKLGKGTSINVIIPEDASKYQLYLVASKWNSISTTQSILNIPLK